MEVKFNAMIYTAEDIADAFDGDGNAIRVNELTGDEAKALIDILRKRNINICLIPE